MIDLFVSLNGEEFEVRAQGDVYNGDLPDFNAAVKAALHAHFLKHPIDPLDSASLEVSVRRVHTEAAARDGVLDDPESPRADLAEDDEEDESETQGDSRDERDAEDRNDDADGRTPSRDRSAAARKAAETRRRNRKASEDE